MESVLLYLAKSGALLALFWGAYHFLLKRETFFRSNRWFLMAGLVTSMLLPLVTFNKVILVDKRATDIMPIEPMPVMQAEADFNWTLIWLVAYALGIAVMAAKFAIDYVALRRTLRGRKVLKQSDFRLVDTPEHVAPFSYFNYIVYNSSLYDEVDLRNILEHEKVHSQQLHSIDMLAAKIYCILFWFNPFAWLYKRSILQNLEFIADSEAIQLVADRKSYQLTMLKVTAHLQNVDISNQFFQSLIKKRIVMLNKNQSKIWQSWKYLTVVPALAAFLLYFQVRVVAQEKEQGMVNEAIAGAQSGVRMVIDKNSSDSQLKQEAAMLKKEHGVTMKFSKVKRNSNGEITSIKAEFKDKNGKSGTTQISSDDPINPISFYKNHDGSVGFGAGSWRNGPGGEAFVFRHHPPRAPGAPNFPRGRMHPDAPGAPVPGQVYEIDTENDRHVIIRSNKDGKPTLIVNGEVVADVDKILSEIEPLKEGFAYRFSNNEKDMILNAEEMRKISRDAARSAREQVDMMRPEIEKMERELQNIDLAKVKRGTHDQRNLTREEMEHAKKEMEAAKLEMIKAKEEMIKAKEELEKAR